MSHKSKSPVTRRDALCKYSRAVDSLLARPTLRTARSGLRA